jgi:thiamine-monophosphate kinase
LSTPDDRRPEGGGLRPEDRSLPASGTRHPVPEFTEATLIDYIKRRLPPSPAWLRVPIGDDAAVVEPARGAFDVLTTDTLVEGIHFDFAFCSPEDVGVKAVAVNLSDLAAMGAEPRAALVSLSVPVQMARERLEAMIDALVAAAAGHCLAIAGGNVTASPGPLVVTMTATGSVRPRRALLRSGARPGDAVYVSAAIGAAAAGLEMLREGRQPAADDEVQCVERYRRPEPRVRLGLLLGRTRAATACIDLSDGMADGARQLARASGAGIVLEADAIPVHPAARRHFARKGVDPVLGALAGGDDYELLFTSAPRRRGALGAAVRRAPGLAVTRIGIVTKEPEVRLRRGDTDEPLPEGFHHFRP